MNRWTTDPRRKTPGAGPLRGTLPLVAALASLLTLSACGGLHGPPPQGAPSGRDGWVIYTVGTLRLEAPAAWTPSGSANHLKLEMPGQAARLEVSIPEAPFHDEQACLAGAEGLMKRGEAMQRVRRHPTRFGGARALTLEGDSGGWHVWAWAACDGGVQYQVFLTARSPAPAEVVEAYQVLTRSARIGGEV
jgi:hypothetical protein